MIQATIRLCFTICRWISLATLFAALSWATGVSAAPNTNAGAAITAIDVGMNGYFKVGCWTTIRVDTAGVEGLKNPRVEVTVPDSDGVPTTVSASLSGGPSGGGSRSILMYTKVGRVGSLIQIALVDGDTRVDERTI